MIPPTEADDRYLFVPIGANRWEDRRRRPSRAVRAAAAVPDGGDTAAPAVQRLHPADAVVALMQETLDAERFGDAAAALRATRNRVSLRCTHDGHARRDGRRDRVAVPAPSAQAARRLDVPADNACSPGVTTVGIGDRVVVHNTATGQIFALDEGGTRVWPQLGGWATDGEIDIEGPVIASFVTQLRNFGVLEGAR